MSSHSIVVDPTLERLRSLIARAREQLSEAQSEYMAEKARIAALQAELFGLLREHYERRDTLRLLVQSRRAELEALRKGDLEQAARTEAQFHEQKARIAREYSETANEFAGRRKLNPQQKSEIVTLWKKLVKLYHPDRFATESDKLATYHALTAAINKAKDAGDIETLREIAADPHAFVARHGWVDLDLREEEELEQLRKLHAALLLEITAVLDSLANLRATQEFRLCLKSDMEPQGLAGIASTLAVQLQTECEALGNEEEKLALEIARLRLA